MTDNRKKDRKINFEPILWSSLLYIIGLVLAFVYISPLKELIETGELGAPPEISLLPILAYFFGAVIVIGLVLFFIPASRLKIVLRVLFGFFYTWGIFIIISLAVPFPAAVALGLACGLLWFFLPLIWLQNLLLLVTLVSLGAVFGTLVSPWTVIFVLIAISVYDVVAVSLGYMMWMAKRLSATDTLPAFIFPKNLGDWNLNLKGNRVKKLFEESGEREFSLLGGGDIGFPLIFVASVFFAYDFNSALIVAAASLAGIIFAFLLQMLLLKGKPLPALPPISFLSILGFLFVYFQTPAG